MRELVPAVTQYKYSFFYFPVIFLKSPLRRDVGQPCGLTVRGTLQRRLRMMVRACRSVISYYKIYVYWLQIPSEYYKNNKKRFSILKNKVIIQEIMKKICYAA